MVANIFLVLFVSFYLFRDGETIVAKLVNALPLERKRAEDLVAKTRTIISASVNGVLVIAALQGALGGLMFWILGLPSPLVWGVVMSVLAMLPVGGTGIIWLPAALILIFTGHWIKGVILLVFGALIISTVDNILRPRLVGRPACTTSRSSSGPRRPEGLRRGRIPAGSGDAGGHLLAAVDLPPRSER